MLSVIGGVSSGATIRRRRHDHGRELGGSGRKARGDLETEGLQQTKREWDGWNRRRGIMADQEGGRLVDDVGPFIIHIWLGGGLG